MTNVSKKDIVFEPVKGGIHAGGQHAQKNATGVRATHLPTGTVVVIRGRSLQTSKRKAVEAIRRTVNIKAEQRASSQRNARRKQAIKDRKHIRTYNFKSQTVIDHRTGKTASLKEVVGKGNLAVLGTMDYFRALKQKEQQ